MWIRVAAVVAYAVAVALRLREVEAVMVLADGMGPWLTATASPVNPHPHAPPYGWALYVPYAALLAGASSLIQAVGGLAWLHALAAPLAAWCAGRLGGLGPAVIAGAVVALDPGLLDTFTSGAETYLGPVWVGLLTALALAAQDRPRLALAVGLAWACAVMNHPLAVVCLPLVALAGRTRWTLSGLVVAGVMLVPTVLGWWEAGGTGLDPTEPLKAVPTWTLHGGPGAGLLLVSAVLALRVQRTWRLALATIGATLLLIGVGLVTGYLRDHHVRLLTVPYAGCIAAFGARWAWLALVCLRWPATDVPPSDKPHRPGTIGLSTELTTAIASLPPPLLVDGAWVTGTPAAEPSAVLLDLDLRGHPIGPGGSLVVVVSYRRGKRPPWSRVWRRGDRHFLVAEEHHGLAELLCGHARLGGAWDGLAVLRPDTTLEEARAWWAGCETP